MGTMDTPTQLRLISEANRSFLASVRPNESTTINHCPRWSKHGKIHGKIITKESLKNIYIYIILYYIILYYIILYIYIILYYIYIYICVLEIQVISLNNITVLMIVCNQLSSVQNLLSFQCTEVYLWTKNGMPMFKVIPSKIMHDPGFGSCANDRISRRNHPTTITRFFDGVGGFRFLCVDGVKGMSQGAKGGCECLCRS